MDKIKQVIINESHERIDVDWIVELWGRGKIETKKMIQEAIVRCDLVGVIEERSENYDDGFKEVTSKNRIAKINDGWLGDNYCRFIVDRDDFTAWLKKSKQWPISNETPLYQWLNDGLKQTEQSETTSKSETLNSNEPRKRQNQLHIFIWRVYQSFDKKPTAQTVWHEIQHRHQLHDESKIIQEVNGKEILWCSGYGNEQKLKRISFNKTLSNIKKNPPF